MTFASIVKRLNEITPDMFKCLIFVQGLTAPKDAEIRSRLLTKLEQDQKITLQNLVEECQHILNLRADTALVRNKPKGRKKETSFKIIPCFDCGELHLFKNCLLRHEVTSPDTLKKRKRYSMTGSKQTATLVYVKV